MTTRAHRLVGAAGVFMAALGVSSSSYAANSAKTISAGTVSLASGEATLNGRDARTTTELLGNDLLKTEQSGQMRIYLEDGSLMSLGKNSEVRMVQHEGRPPQTSVEMAHGIVRRQVIVDITQGAGSFQVRTPTAVATALGSDIEVFAAANRTTVNCYAGDCHVAGVVEGAVPTLLHAGQTATVTPEGISQPQRIDEAGSATVTTASNSSDSSGGAAATGSHFAGGATAVIAAAASSAVAVAVSFIATASSRPPASPSTR